MAAILFADGHVLYTDMESSASTLACFRSRKNNQIMGLELLAVAWGLSTYSMILRGRRVRVWSDNTGNEASLRKGRARAFDRNALVHFLTRKAALDKLHLWVGRVPSELNIEILPAGESYEVLHALRAEAIPAVLDTAFTCPEARNLSQSSRYCRERRRPGGLCGHWRLT